MKKVCHNVVHTASLWNRSWVWILSTTFSATTGSSAPSSLPWIWSWCPEGPPVFTPVLLQSVLHTETGVTLSKYKQVVPHLCSAPSDDWGSHLPQNKSQSLYRTHTLNCPYLSDLLPISLSLWASWQFRTLGVVWAVLPQSCCACPSLCLECCFSRELLCSPPHFLWVLIHLLNEASLTTLSTLDTSCCPSLLLFSHWHFSLSNILLILLM